MSRSTALIFGISGQTGSYLAHLLLSQGYIVHGVSRDCEANTFQNLRRLGIWGKVKVHSGVLTDFPGLLRIFNEVHPDEIYNLSGQSSVRLSFEQPVDTFESVALGTLNVLECLRLCDRKIRFFQATSSDCYGDVEGSANELTAFRPRSPYAMAKAASFWAVASYRESYGLHACSGILSNHESPLRPSHFVTRKIILGALAIASGNADTLELGDLSVERDWGWAPDYARAIWQILQCDTPMDFNVATGVCSSLQTFVEVAFTSLGLDWEKYVCSVDKYRRPGEVKRVAISPDRAYSVLGWKAQICMPGLVDQLLKCERDGSLGV